MGVCLCMFMFVCMICMYDIYSFHPCRISVYTVVRWLYSMLYVKKKHHDLWLMFNDNGWQYSNNASVCFTNKLFSQYTYKFGVVQDTQTGVTAFTNRRVNWELSIQNIDAISHNTEIIKIFPQHLWAGIIRLRHSYDAILRSLGFDLSFWL